MKKVLLLLVCVLCLFFVACAPAQPKEGAEYTYKQMSFKRGKDLQIQDLPNFMPMAAAFPGGELPQSVDEFEDFLLEFLDSSSINRQTENGQERVF